MKYCAASLWQQSYLFWVRVDCGYELFWVRVGIGYGLTLGTSWLWYELVWVRVNWHPLTVIVIWDGGCRHISPSPSPFISAPWRPKTQRCSDDRAKSSKIKAWYSWPTCENCSYLCAPLIHNTVTQRQYSPFSRPTSHLRCGHQHLTEISEAYWLPCI